MRNPSTQMELAHISSGLEGKVWRDVFPFEEKLNVQKPQDSPGDAGQSASKSGSVQNQASC
jgi:hypothetical protein